MASETSSEQPESMSGFLERLISSRNRDLSFFVPLILGMMGAPRRNHSQSNDEQNPEEEEEEEEAEAAEEETDPSRQTHERIILINPITQGMIVIQGGTTTLEALVRNISEMESAKEGAPPASKASIEAIPTVKIEEEEATECAICLEGMEEAKEMTCKHRYHSDCIGKWLEIHGTCPVCRFAMPAEEGAKKGGGLRDGAEGDEGRRRDIWVSFSLNRTQRDSLSAAVERSEEEDE